MYDIKNQDNLLKQGEQIHTNCFMEVSKINFYSDDNMKHDYVVFPGFELTGHITKTLYADEISCGLSAFKMKTANLTTANLMLMMQRRNVN